MKLGFLGPKGTFSYEACLEYEKVDGEYVYNSDMTSKLKEIM